MTILKDTTDHLYDLLLKAAGQREQRSDLTPGPDGVECEWAAYERSCMHEAVNALRTSRGLTQLPIEEVIRVERTASGHIDYARKYAFYCAELALLT